ncbi:DUF6481 family protein [Rhizobium sp. RCAM05973]|uniref:DUF6481 family protein n=1 Tax=Rhizobium sp. RCAM05973 TaxID=2994066 RepID=UPI0022EBDE8C|nr:DUF6481 family protein [Rhizobium sp. RCAM05973]
MKNAKNNDLTDRRAAAAEAKNALLTAYRTAKAAAEPTKLARHVERIAVADGREERRLERERLKLEERERLLVEATRQQEVAVAAARAETEARETVEQNRIARLIEDEATRKADRDRRYANRKARQA